jgi:predicted MFS family arabinose efflux permease
MVSKRMRPVLPEIAWTGISIAVYTGLIVPIIYDTLPDEDSDSYKFELSMLAMCSLGVGEIVGGIGMGIIVDKIGSKKSVWVNVVLIILQTILVAAFVYIDEYNALAYIMTFVWGLSDSSISIHLDSILGFEFESNKEPFAVDVLIESCFVMFF